MRGDKLTEKGVGSQLVSSFIADVAQFWADRQDHIMNKLARCEDADNQVSYFFNEIEKQAPHVKNLLMGLEEVINSRHTTTYAAMYRSGFNDGVKFILQSLIND